MDELRRPLFLLAILAVFLAFLLEIGSAAFLGEADSSGLRELAGKELKDMSADEREEALDELEEFNERNEEKPPGYGIPATGLLDGLVILTVALMGIALIVPERLHGRVQGVVTLIVSLVVLIVSIIAIFLWIAELLVMVALLFAAPFGTIAYLAMYAFFPLGQAAGVLGLVMFLKLAFVVLLVLSHQRFLQNKGLVMIILCSLLATFLVGFLQSFPPSVLASITDVLAAIIVAIIAAVWAVIFLIGSIVSVVKAIA